MQTVSFLNFLVSEIVKGDTFFPEGLNSNRCYTGTAHHKGGKFFVRDNAGFLYLYIIHILMHYLFVGLEFSCFPKIVTEF